MTQLGADALDKGPASYGEAFCPLWFPSDNVPSQALLDRPLVMFSKLPEILGADRGTNLIEIQEAVAVFFIWGRTTTNL